MVSGGNYQVYVAENTTGSWVVHQLTNNINANWVNAATVSPQVLCMNGFVYVVYPDIYSSERGVAVYQSNDGFATSVKFYPEFRFNPGWTLNYDPTVYPAQASFLFMDADDYQYGVVYVNKTVGNPNLGNLSLCNWIPSPGSSHGIPTDMYGVNTLSTNYLQITGSTSGLAVLTAPAIAGTPVIELPTTSGTLALASALTSYLPLAGGTMTGPLALGSIKVAGLVVYASNAAAITGGLLAGNFYRTGADPDVVCVVH
jgi:hypothetical protein